MISKYKSEWEKLGDSVATNIMTTGLRLNFHTKPILSLQPPPRARISKHNLPILRPFIPTYLERGIIREIVDPQYLYFSSLFPVPKKGNSFRPVINLSHLNLLLNVPKFKMESVAKIALCLLEPLWGITVDLEDAFFHVPIAWEFHKYFAFEIDGKIYVFQFMPFGLSPAPWAFTRVINPVMSHLHSLPKIIFCLLDDFLILAHSPSQLEEDGQIIMSKFQSLGLSINFKKSTLTPSQEVEYLGVIFHLDTLEFSIPKDKIDAVFLRSKQIASNHYSTRRELESLIGQIGFISTYLPLGRLYILPLISWLNAHSSPATRDSQLSIDNSFTSFLQIWQDPVYLQRRTPMSIPTPTLQLMTDASLTGWGGVLLPDSISGVWSKNQQRMSINWLELKAIQLSLIYFLPVIKGRLLLILTDNTTAVSCIRRQGTLRSEPLMSLSKKILEFCFDHKITLVPKHLPGRLNVLADSRSRQTPIDTEWSLDLTTFNTLWHHFGPFSIDLFANRENNKLKDFISPFPDPLSSGVNALSLHWEEWDSLYIFPPVPMMEEVLAHLQTYQGKGVLIAPFFAQSRWFPQLLIRCPIHHPLPEGYSLSQRICQGIAYHNHPEWFRLHVWLL